MSLLSRKLPMLAVLVLSASLQPMLACAQTGVAALNGPFAFLLEGALTIPGVPSRATAAVGSFTADGQGNITSGEMDFTSAAETLHALSITGSYTLNNDSGAGTLTLTSTMGSKTFAIYTAGGGLAAYSSGSLIETDGGPVVSSGSFYQQSSETFQIYGYWRMCMTGETFVTKGTPSPIYVDGNLSFPIQNPPELEATVTIRVGSNAPESLSRTLRGPQYPVTSSFGRVLFGVMPGESGYPLNLVIYFVDDLHILVISADPSQVNPLMSGMITRDSTVAQ